MNEKDENTEVQRKEKKNGKTKNLISKQAIYFICASFSVFFFFIRFRHIFYLQPNHFLFLYFWSIVVVVAVVICVFLFFFFLESISFLLSGHQNNFLALLHKFVISKIERILLQNNQSDEMNANRMTSELLRNENVQSKKKKKYCELIFN